MGEKIGEVTAALIKNPNETINVILEPRTPEEDSFADQVVKEIEEFEQLALVI